MTFCFVSDSYPLSQPFGGIAVYTQTAARAMTARGHKVHVVVGWHSEARDMMDGMIHIHYRTMHWLPVIGKILPGLGESLCLAKVLRELNKQYQFDLVEFPNFEGKGLVFQTFTSIPVVVRLYTSMVESVETQHRRPTWSERFMMWTERQSARLARDVATHSSSHLDRLAKTYGLREIRLIKLGIHPPTARVQEASALSVLTIGRLSERKGGATLLAAIAHVHEQLPDVTFTIVGPTDEDSMVRSFRDAHPSIPHSSVVCRSLVSDEELDELYKASTIYVSASIYESFGLTFVEAMARGIAVVGCAVSAMNEVITHQSTGLLVPPGDSESFATAIVTLLRDAPLRVRMGQEGRRVALEKYTAERMGAEIETWYGEVLKRSK